MSLNFTPSTLPGSTIQRSPETTEEDAQFLPVENAVPSILTVRIPGHPERTRQSTEPRVGANNLEIPRKIRRRLAVGTSTISMMMGGALLLGAAGTTLGGPILAAGAALLGAGIGIVASVLARSDAPPKD